MSHKARTALFDQATSYPALEAAFFQERSRNRSPGIDRMTPAKFERQLKKKLEKLSKELRKGDYRGMPILRFHKKKKSGGKRPLGICALRDRIVQRALLTTLTPVYEQRFLDCSHGYRPGRSAHTALHQIDDYRRKNYLWAYEADIENCFGSVHPDLLAKEIDNVCGDIRMRRLILRIVQGGVLENGIMHQKYLGIPQGSPLSPLLANIYLHPFDKGMIDAGYQLVRYADDFLVLAQSEQEADEAGLLAERLLRKRKHKTPRGEWKHS